MLALAHQSRKVRNVDANRPRTMRAYHSIDTTDCSSAGNESTSGTNKDRLSNYVKGIAINAKETVSALHWIVVVVQMSCSDSYPPSHFCAFL